MPEDRGLLIAALIAFSCAALLGWLLAGSLWR